MLNTHLCHSQTGLPFSCFFTSGNRKESQGERSGEYGGCGSSCTSLESPSLLLLCAHWHCHCEGNSHGVPSLGGAGTKLRRPSGDMMHVPVCSDSPSVFKRSVCDVGQFSEDTGSHFLLCAAWSSELWGRGLVRKQPDR